MIFIEWVSVSIQLLDYLQFTAEYNRQTYVDNAVKSVALFGIGLARIILVRLACRFALRCDAPGAAGGGESTRRNIQLEEGEWHTQGIQ